jgi:hypothetical protein
VSCLLWHLQDVSGAMQPKLRAAFSLLHLNALRVTRPAINATFSTLKRRLLNVDPWLPVETQVCTRASKQKELAAGGRLALAAAATHVSVDELAGFPAYHWIV